MTDKEQINDSLKNSDKNFNENCTHEKEQIIIDGVCINTCLVSEKCKEFKTCKMKNILKQLTRKTQECEELKEANRHIDTNRQCKGSKLKRIEDLISACKIGYTDEFTQEILDIIQEPEPTINDYSIIDRYSETLKTIEEICLNDVHVFADGTQLRYDSLDDILDVINRLKEELWI